MPSNDAVDRFFTAHIVGAPMRVTMGVAASAQVRSDHGAWVDLLDGQVDLIGTAARSLWADASGLPAQDALAGLPLTPQKLSLARRRVLIGAAVVWSCALCALSWAVGAMTR